jgi:hypothetical protein
MCLFLSQPLQSTASSSGLIEQTVVEECEIVDMDSEVIIDGDQLGMPHPGSSEGAKRTLVFDAPMADGSSPLTVTAEVEIKPEDGGDGGDRKRIRLVRFCFFKVSFG